MPNPAQKQPIIPLVGTTRAVAALSLGLASFISVVDITIANVSVPTISGNLGVSPDQGEWIMTSFAIANAISIPLTGWLSRRFGQVRLFLASVIAFTVASILCGLSGSFEVLLFFRVVQGAVSGPLQPLSQALLVAVFPPQLRSLAVGIWAMTATAGPVCGPLLGGWITDTYSWPWIFLVNAPIGVFVVFSTMILLRGRETPTLKLPVDVRGLLLLAVAVGCLQVTLDRGRVLDWLSSSFICATAIVSAVGFVVLVVWELGEEHPIIDLRLFAYRNFAVGTIAITLGFSLYFAALVLTPLWLQTNMGYDSIWAGLVTAPMGLFGILVAPFLGQWIRKADVRLFASFAFLAFALVSWWRATMTTEVDAVIIGLATFGQGVGLGLLFTPLVSLSLVGLPLDKVASATGLQTAIRMMAGSLMASLAQTFWDQRARFHQTYLVETLNPFNENTSATLARLRQGGLSEDQAWGVIARQLDGQTHMLSLNDFFLASAFAFIAALTIIWFARAPRKAS